MRLLDTKWEWSHSVMSDSCDPMDRSSPGFSVHGIFQARILEWVAISFSRRSSWPRDWTQVSRVASRCFTIWATREAHKGSWLSNLSVLALALVWEGWRKTGTRNYLWWKKSCIETGEDMLWMSIVWVIFYFLTCTVDMKVIILLFSYNCVCPQYLWIKEKEPIPN